MRWRELHPLMISGTPVERVISFKYLGVNISEDLTWTTHIQTQVKKARQRLYHLRQLRKFRVSPAILKTFYSGAIESVLTQCISVWYGNSSKQDCKALQRVVRLAERISGSTLPSSTSNAVKAELLHLHFTFTFMHLADAFIQSDLQLHSGYTFVLVHVFPGNRTHNLSLSWRNALPLSHTGTKIRNKNRIC